MPDRNVASPSAPKNPNSHNHPSSETTRTKSPDSLLSHATEVLKSEINSQFNSQREETVGHLENLASALRLSEAPKDESGQTPPMNDYVEKAATQIDQAADYVRSLSLSESLHQVVRFARREPGLFLGGAFVMGIVLARFMKASTDTAYRSDKHSEMHSAKGSA